jgi:T-complex protein 1 subunit alpha
VELAELQDAEVGDGTTSVVIVAAELLKRAGALVRSPLARAAAAAHPTRMHPHRPALPRRCHLDSPHARRMRRRAAPGSAPARARTQPPSRCISRCCCCSHALHRRR